MVTPFHHEMRDERHCKSVLVQDVTNPWNHVGMATILEDHG
jgi:hypothetical protein